MLQWLKTSIACSNPKAINHVTKRQVSNIHVEWLNTITKDATRFPVGEVNVRPKVSGTLSCATCFWQIPCPPTSSWARLATRISTQDTRHLDVPSKCR